jgi:hypothetical protein
MLPGQVLSKEHKSIPPCSIEPLNSAGMTKVPLSSSWMVPESVMTALGSILDRSTSLQCKDSRVDHKDLRQMHQFFLSCQLGQSSSFNHKVEGRVKKLAAMFSTQAFRAFSSTSTTVSLFQQQVASTFKDMGAHIQQEASDARSGYSIDCLVHAWGEHKGLRIAVEADGPTHFVQDGRGKKQFAANGATQMKRRHLGLLGYAVISVPYWEWYGLANHEARVKYLQEKLLAVLQVKDNVAWPNAKQS